jgi:hypothetical protein
LTLLVDRVQTTEEIFVGILAIEGTLVEEAVPVVVEGGAAGVTIVETEAVKLNAIIEVPEMIGVHHLSGMIEAGTGTAGIAMTILEVADNLLLKSEVVRQITVLVSLATLHPA